MTDAADGRPDPSDSRKRASGGLPMSRRRILRLMGPAAIGLVPGAVVALNLVGTKAGSAQSESSADHNEGGRLRRWTMMIDLRRCDGCQSQDSPPLCTQACIEGHYAPEPMEWIEVYEGELPGGGTQFIPTPCQHCQNPPCLNVCPVGATFSTPEGVVLIDQKRCIGCRICMTACPYDRRFFNWGEPPQPPQASDLRYDVEHQSGAIRGTVMKCDLCPDMARAGSLPYCAQACPNTAIYYGDLEEDIATNGREVVSMSRYLSENSGYQLKEELGTKPRVFYIPGHGEDVGRSPFTHGRKASVWPWNETREGSETWTR